MSKNNEKRPVIITTERRGVFFGYLDKYDEDRRVAVLSDSSMAIRWGTTKGLFELANSGPTGESQLSAVVPEIRLELCECIINVTADAEAAWKKALS